MLFADDELRAARNSGDVKGQKGWGRKLKNVLDTLGAAGENIKNIQDGGEVVKSGLSGIKRTPCTSFKPCCHQFLVFLTLFQLIGVLI